MLINFFIGIGIGFLIGGVIGGYLGWKYGHRHGTKYGKKDGENDALRAVVARPQVLLFNSADASRALLPNTLPPISPDDTSFI